MLVLSNGEVVVWTHSFDEAFRTRSVSLRQQRHDPQWSAAAAANFHG